LKQIDWPEAIWEAWLTFENLHGSVTTMNVCSVKVLKAQYFNNDRRAKVCAISGLTLYTDMVWVRRQRGPGMSSYRPQRPFKMPSVLSQLDRHSLVMP